MRKRRFALLVAMLMLLVQVGFAGQTAFAKSRHPGREKDEGGPVTEETMAEETEAMETEAMAETVSPEEDPDKAGMVDDGTEEPAEGEAVEEKKTIAFAGIEVTLPATAILWDGPSPTCQFSDMEGAFFLMTEMPLAEEFTGMYDEDLDEYLNGLFYESDGVKELILAVYPSIRVNGLYVSRAIMKTSGQSMGSEEQSIAYTAFVVNWDTNTGAMMVFQIPESQVNAEVVLRAVDILLSVRPEGAEESLNSRGAGAAVTGEITAEETEAAMEAETPAEEPAEEAMAEAASEETVTATVSGTADTDVYIRTGPSFGTEVLGVLEDGTTITLIEYVPGGWSPVEYNGVIGYINSEYLTVE